MVIPDKGNICNFSQHRLVYCGKIVENCGMATVGYRWMATATNPIVDTPTRISGLGEFTLEFGS